MSNKIRVEEIETETTEVELKDRCGHAYTTDKRTESNRAYLLTQQDATA